jgi:hypothetical protein
VSRGWQSGTPPAPLTGRSPESPVSAAD